MQLPELVAKLQAIAQNNQDRRIFVRGDKDLAYGRIMEVMGTITQGGFTSVALLAEQPTTQPAAAPPVPAAPAAPAPQHRPSEGRVRAAACCNASSEVRIARTAGTTASAPLCDGALSSPRRSMQRSSWCC